MPPCCSLIAVNRSFKQPQTHADLPRDDTRIKTTSQVGSLRLVVDSGGSIVKRIEYDSFGNILSDSNAGFSIPFGFAGGLHDRDTGLIRFGYRDYLPEIGKWTAKDPIDFAGGDSNLYGYVQNDPVNWVDTWGLWVKNPPGGVPVYVKPENNSQPIGILPPGYEWPGSPDGSTPVTGNDAWDKYRGWESTPENCVEVDKNGKGNCVGGTCSAPFMQTTKPRSDPDWAIPPNPKNLPGITPIK